MGLARSFKNSVLGLSDARGLTGGEVRLLQSVYRDQIDYSQIKIRTLKLPSFFAAIAPHNTIYFSKENYCDDFSKSSVDEQSLLVHEAAHAWQYQKGEHLIKSFLSLVWKSSGDYGSVYKFDPLEIKNFSELNFEQQARAFEKCFLLNHTLADNQKVDHAEFEAYDRLVKQLLVSRQVQVGLESTHS